jgi:phosphopantothenate---cysteine ligase (ATP)
VIGNDLNRRKFEVVFVSRVTATSSSSSSSSSPLENEPEESSPSTTVKTQEGGAGLGGRGGFMEQWVTIDPAAAADGSKEIEEDIVAELVKKHDGWARL